MVFRADYDGTFGQKRKIRYSWDPICAANCVTGIGNQFDTRMMSRHWAAKGRSKEWFTYLKVLLNV